MIDMSKAFDRMDPNILIDKLRIPDVKDVLINLINIFLTYRTCRVKMDNSISDPLPVTMGAPQCTLLRPWLWLVYILGAQPYVFEPHWLISTI